MERQTLLAALKNSSNIYTNTLFGLGVLNLLKGDLLNAGVWLSIAVGGLAIEIQERHNPARFAALWRKAQWASVSVASVFAGLMIYNGIQ